MKECCRRAINTPEVQDFLEAVKIEAAYQRSRWRDSDPLKTSWDWWQLIVYLSGKAFFTPARYRSKILHRIVTVAAAAYNWHSAQKSEAAR